ncbi:MAG: autoantigen p27 domain-containing protein [Nitrosopumilus sp.]|nr:autoantigen p27 domain-containing protein [Nitrosopumilus sp.]MDH3832991.1 autoantigen p27 domain-containing protein [Nitrosopumilus sp.]
MKKDLTKKAAEMLLQGATLLSEPCPYCAGVRVMKEGHALCISCGREPKKKDIPKEKNQQESTLSLEDTLEKKLKFLSKELEEESNYEKQQEILKTINSLLETLEKSKTINKI